MARSNFNRKSSRKTQWISLKSQQRSSRCGLQPAKSLGLGLESLEPRLALDGTGLGSNDCAPDLDLSAVANQTAVVGQELTFDIYTEGATVTDLDDLGAATGDTIRLLLDPDVPADTPTGATITPEGVFSWTPAAGQEGTYEIVVIAVDEGDPPLADAEVFTVVVGASNTLPEVDLNGAAAGIDFSATYTEGDDPVAIVDPGLTVTDAENNDISGAAVRITNLVDTGFEVLSVTEAGNVTALYASATGILTLSGTDSLAVYQQVLSSLRYNHSNPNPTAGDREIEVVVSDGSTTSAPATATVTVVPVNDPPNLDLNGSDTGTGFLSTYNQGDDPVVIVSPDTFVTDVDNTTMMSATATINDLRDGASEVLDVDRTNTNLAIAYANGVLTITGEDTIAAYEEVIRSLTYENTDDLPTEGARNIQIRVNDGTDDSPPRLALVTVVATNSPPVIEAIDDQQATVGVQLVVPVVVTDANAGDVITFDLDSGSSPTGAQIQKTGDRTAQITWTPTASNVGSPAIFVVLASDNGSPSRSDSETFSVTVADARPEIDLNGPAAGTGFAASFTEGDDPVLLAAPDLTVGTTSGFDFTSATVTLTNPQDGDAEVLTVDETLRPAITVTYNDGVLTLTGETLAADYATVLASLRYENTSEDPTPGDRNIEVIVSEAALDSLTAISVVTVAAVNDGPDLTLPTPFGDGTPVDALTGTPITFDTSVVDVDHGSGELFYRVDTDASGLPDGAAEPTISNPEGQFSWTPDTPGTYTFRIIVTDAEGAPDQEAVTFTVTEPDTTPPSVATPPASTFDSNISMIGLVYSEEMGASAFDIANYTLVVDGETTPITLTSVTTTDNLQATITLDTALVNENYRLTLNDTAITDLAGNALTGAASFDFEVDAVAAAFAELGEQS